MAGLLQRMESSYGVDGPISDELLRLCAFTPAATARVAPHWHAWQLHHPHTLVFVGCFPNPAAAWDAAGSDGRVRQYEGPGA